MTDPKPSPLFRFFESQHGDQPWGSVLDAGTGAKSLSWVASQPTDRWTAVTGSASHLDIVTEAIGTQKRAQDNLILGNWADPALLKGETFDTVLADYLLGAIEGFAPYFQGYLFARLRPLTAKNFYFTGLEPYVVGDKPASEPLEILWKIGRFRDACVLLKGGSPYREYPAQWAADHMRASGFKVLGAKHFKISYRAEFINAQINISLSSLHGIGQPDLEQALTDQGEVLRERALQHIEKEGALRGARNYAIAAEVA